MLVYMLGIFVYFILKIIYSNNKAKDVLLAAGYIMGAEVYLRMTKAMVFYETGKYGVILFSLIGLFYFGFKKNAFPYALYILFLLPGVLVTYDVISYDSNFRTTVLFSLSGPLCLSFAAIFTYGRSISFKDFLKVLDYIVYPIISMTVYVFLRTPDVRAAITGTASSFALSGGYGPNQVAVMFGLGFFILLTRFVIPYKNPLVHWAMMFFLPVFAYRALLTFSRGGVLVAGVMCVVFIVILYFSPSFKKKVKLSFSIIGIIGIGLLIWSYTIFQTGGMIGNRYANEDALGREKEDLTTGRGELMAVELENFKENPYFGIGVGRGKFEFAEELGISTASHNEISRMISEHGVFGLFALLVLVFAPIITKVKGRKNIYFWPFLIFWFLTIAHSSMRIAAPAFIYALCLLNIDYGTEKKTSLRRK